MAVGEDLFAQVRAAERRERAASLGGERNVLPRATMGGIRATFFTSRIAGKYPDNVGSMISRSFEVEKAAQTGIRDYNVYARSPITFRYGRCIYKWILAAQSGAVVRQFWGRAAFQALRV